MRNKASCNAREPHSSQSLLPLIRNETSTLLSEALECQNRTSKPSSQPNPVLTLRCAPESSQPARWMFSKQAESPVLGMCFLALQTVQSHMQKFLCHCCSSTCKGGIMENPGPLGGTQEPGGHRTCPPTSPLWENCFVEVMFIWLRSIFPHCQSPEVTNKPTILTLPECQSMTLLVGQPQLLGASAGAICSNICVLQCTYPGPGVLQPVRRRSWTQQQNRAGDQPCLGRFDPQYKDREGKTS